MIPRLPQHAYRRAEVQQYFETREMQLAFDGFRWSWDLDQSILGGQLIYTTTFALGNQVYRSAYLPVPARGKGLARKVFNGEGVFVTTEGCGIASLMDRLGQPYVLQARHTEWPEYKAIEARYLDTKSKRGKQFYMNHIDQGLIVLKNIGASNAAMKAFCLHPLCQDDEDFKTFDPAGFDPEAVTLAMEYRHTANRYLSKDRPPEYLYLSCKAVADMLVADKVQNAKDLHKHLTWIDDYQKLAAYFEKWFDILGIKNKVGEIMDPIANYNTATGRRQGG